MKPRSCSFTSLAISFIMFASTGVQLALSQRLGPDSTVSPSPATEVAGSPLAASKHTLAQSFERLPLYFVENRGQTDARVAYYVLGGATQVYFSADGVTFALMEPDRGGPRGRDGRGEALLERSSAAPDPPPGATSPVAAGLSRNASPLRGRVDTPRQRWTVKLDFVGANPRVRPVGEGQTEAIVSYFKGAPDQWHAGLPTYARVVYRDLWPGIDLAYYGQAGQLKYDLVVHPGADPAQIRLRYRGAESVRLKAARQMEVGTPLGGFTDDAPLAWQEIAGRRVAVTVAFDLGDESSNARDQLSALYSAPAAFLNRQSAIRNPQSFGFSVGSYDRSRPLVIDPAVLVYCGYIGGSKDDVGLGIAVDGTGNGYVTGYTYSTQDSFPVTGGPDLAQNGGGDAFVAKVSASGAALVYAGYIGGLGWDCADSIAVDSAGNAYVTGDTTSDQTTFPVTGGPDLAYNGGGDAFVAKVSASGAALLYAGYIGGRDWDKGYGIAVDGAGSAYVTGETNGTQATFPVAGGPDLTYNGGPYDAFIAKVSPTGAALVYAGYIGGSGRDYGADVAVDGDDNAYVTGYTGSDQSSFPVTGGPDLTYNGGTRDAFVAKVSASGAALVYAGYIGGSGDDVGNGITVDKAGNSYVTGYTQSTQTTFPATVGPDLTYNGGSYDAFVAKVSASGTALVYAGYIGGSENDQGYGIAVDGTANTYVTGETSSDQATFPVAVGPDLAYNGGTRDAFVAKVSASGAALVYAGYIGGAGDDPGCGIAVDGAGNAYVTGWTSSTEVTFPVSVWPDLTYNGGTWDAFVAKVSTTQRTFLPVIFRPLPPPNLNGITPPGDQRSYPVTWSVVPGADSYVLEEATSPGFTGAGQIYSGPATSHQIVSRGIQRYYYRVKAHGSTGDSNWSNTQWVDVRWEEEPNDDYTQANGSLASGVTYYGLPNNGAPVSGASDHYKDYFMFDTIGGQIDVNVDNLTGQVRVLQVYYGVPELGKYKCQKIYPDPLQCGFDGDSGRYYVHIFTEESTDTVYSLRATLP